MVSRIDADFAGPEGKFAFGVMADQDTGWPIGGNAFVFGFGDKDFVGPGSAATEGPPEAKLEPGTTG